MFAIQPIKSKAIEKLFGNKILTSVVGWSVIALIFYTEYGTDDEYRFGILYQLAVVFFAWYFDIGYVIFVAFICSILRVFSIALHGDTFSSINVPILNSLVRFATFFLTALIMNGLKKSLLAQKESNNNLMRANEEVSRLAAIKSEFTSMVSHELRTPLMVIKEGIGIVQDGSVGIINPDQQKYLDLAKKNVDRLSRLINDVLDFQKLSSSQAEIPTTRNNINKLLLETKEDFLLMAKNKGLDLEVDLEEELQELFLDRDKIEQVLSNLLGNAIKVTEKGKITLRSRRLGNAIRVSVEDQGPGIKSEDISKLFQAFSQLTLGSERKTGGTGLGLAISKQIIEKHHGKIGVESIYGSGSTFYFLLPIEERRDQ